MDLLLEGLTDLLLETWPLAGPRSRGLEVRYALMEGFMEFILFSWKLKFVFK